MKRDFCVSNEQRGKLYFLSSIEIKFCTEWISIHNAIAIFAHEMYRGRKSIYSDKY